MSEYREIVTKAVIGKGRRYTKATHTISPQNHPTSILGCWVINHVYEAKKSDKENYVKIEGYYDLNAWYAYDGNTKTQVVTERARYEEEIKVRHRDKNFTGDDHDVIVRVMQHPNCLEAIISPNGNKIVATVERELICELVGETKICVKVNPEGCEDDDEYYYSVDDEEFEDLDPNFMLDGEEE